MTAIRLRRGRCAPEAKAKTIAAAVSGFLLAVFGLLACSSTPGVSAGHTIPIDKSGRHAGSHRTMDYQVAYAYTFQAAEGDAPDRIQFDGRIIPRRGLTTFVLRMHFLDGGGKVLNTSLYAPGARRGAGRPTISRTIEVPGGAVSMGFSHEAREQRVRRGRR